MGDLFQATINRVTFLVCGIRDVYTRYANSL
jgi:hypothetical protein